MIFYIFYIGLEGLEGPSTFWEGMCVDQKSKDHLGCRVVIL